MLAEPSLEMQAKTREGRRQVNFEHRKLGQVRGPGFYASRVDSDIKVLREYLNDVDEIYRKVWRLQGNEISADFINRVLWPAIVRTISFHERSLRSQFERFASRARFTQFSPVLHHLVQQINNLKSRGRNRYDIEVMTLKYSAEGSPSTKLPPAKSGEQEQDRPALLMDKSFIFPFTPNASEEQIVQMEQYSLAQIGESRGVFAAYNGFPAQYDRLWVEHGLPLLYAWIRSRLRDSSLPLLDAARIHFLVVPSEEYLTDPERDIALRWVEKTKRLKGLNEKILRNATETHDQSRTPATGADAAETEQANPVDATPAAIPMSRTIERGRFWEQVIDEIKRIRNLCVGSGWSIAEIQNSHPDFAVWKVRACLGGKDLETFNQPNQWGPPVGFAKKILAKTSAVSEHTITASVKAYRKTHPPKKL